MELQKDLWEEIKDNAYTYDFEYSIKNRCETVKRVTSKNNFYLQMWYYEKDDVICYSVYDDYDDIKDSGVIYTMEDYEKILNSF